MGELRKNTTSIGTITKKPGSFSPYETVGTKNIFLCSIFFLFVDETQFFFEIMLI